MIGYINDLVYVCAPAPLQIGVAAGIADLTDAHYRGLCAQYLAKRDLFCDYLLKAGLRPHVPQGAYYVLADVSGVPGGTSKKKAMHILERTGVACVPGNSFYHAGGGEDLVRFCFAKEDAVLRAAGEKLLGLFS